MSTQVRQMLKMSSNIGGENPESCLHEWRPFISSLLAVFVDGFTVDNKSWAIEVNI